MKKCEYSQIKCPNMEQENNTCLLRNQGTCAYKEFQNKGDLEK